jgi:hypothetical protein
LEEKSSAEGVSESDQKKHADQIVKEEEAIAEIEALYEPALEKLLAAVGKSAAAASSDDKKVMGPIVLNLIEAVDDAQNANSAAVMQYPMAVPGMQDDLPAAVKRFVADVVEEQTDSRPDMSSFSPDVKLEGGDVKLSLNGIPAEKLGDLDVEELLTEVTLRTTKYVERAATLAVYIADTEDRLSFQSDLLEVWQGGLQATVEGTDGAVDISDLEVASAAAGAKPAASAKSAQKEGEEGEEGKAQVSGKRSVAGIRVAACAGAEPTQKVVKADEPEKTKKAKKAKKAPKKKAAKRQQRIATTLDVQRKPSKKRRPKKKARKRKANVAHRTSLDTPKKPSWATAPAAHRPQQSTRHGIDSEVPGRYVDDED